ncbi:MAG TPA: CdaR family protein [Candidatus Binatia bacterium]|jgi:YbbR domain-containing protein
MANFLAEWRLSSEALRDWRRYTAPLRRNTLGKLFALLVAFLMWFFVNAGKRETQVLQFPVEFRNMPPSAALVQRERVDSVSVRLNGPGALLASLDGRRAPVIVDLSTIELGTEMRLKVRDEMIRVPRGVRILDVEPARIPIRLEQIRQATIPVRLVRVGEPADGFKVETIKVAPANVVVSGPASTIEAMQFVETEPFELTGLNGNVQRAVGLVRGERVLSVTPERVLAQVTIEQVRITRDVKRVAVEVRNADRPFQLRPARVNLTVRGPQRLVQGLDLDPGSVYVDAAQLGVGEHMVEPEVILPSGIELVKRDPPAVSLEILDKDRVEKPQNGSPDKKNGARR